jgi:lipoprotein-anchoring transpeptidase ErfK/SrfK
MKGFFLAAVGAAWAVILGSAAPPPPVPHRAARYVPAESAESHDRLFAALNATAVPLVPADPVPVAAEPRLEAGARTPPLERAIRVVVSIPQQKAYVFKNGLFVDTSAVSTGRRGHETPTGRFRVLQKEVEHYSSRYDNAPMPYMQRLTSYGIALHAGRVPGYPASHGCIRLPRGFAKRLYKMTGTGTAVTVTRERPSSPKEALRLS